MRIEVLEGADAVGSLEEEWHGLASVAAEHVFQTYEFLWPYVRHVAVPKGMRPMVAVALDGDRLVGLFPACLMRLAGLTLLTWLGSPWVLDYGDVLLDPAAAHEDADAFVGDALDALMARAPHSLVFLPNVREDATCYTALRSRMREQRTSCTHSVSLAGGFDALEASLSRQTRQGTRRRLRRLERRGDCRLEVLRQGDPNIDEVVSAIVVQKRQRYATPGSRTILFDDDYVALYRDHAHNHPSVHISRLMLDGEMLATHLGYLHRGRLYLILQSFADEWQQSAPGRVALYLLLAECCRQGIETLDFCLGDEPYKTRWASRTVCQKSFVSRGLPGLLFTAGAHVRRQARQALARGSPPPS